MVVSRYYEYYFENDDTAKSDCFCDVYALLKTGAANVTLFL